MPRRKISDFVQAQVRRRAKQLCEYCHASEQWQYVRFTIEHVIPLDVGGSNELSNLALACFHCNRRKSNRTTGTDPDSNLEVPLFNPRRDRWSEHFTWSTDEIFIVARSSTGKVTISMLRLNRERILSIRAADKAVGRHPPQGDPVQKE